MADASPPNGSTPASPPSWTSLALRPRIALPVLTALLVVAVLLTPESAPVVPDRRVTTYSTGPGGASGIYDIAKTLGWRPSRRETPLTGTLDSGAVYAVLAPANPVSAAATHALLDAVRNGAGLMYIVSDTGALEDSLQVYRADTGYAPTQMSREARGACPTDDINNMLVWFREGVHLYRLDARRAVMSDMPVFVTVDRPASGSKSAETEPAAFGFTLGRGRVVVYSDADLLRNDVVRICKWGIGLHVIQSLDWVSGGRRRPLVFDEYDQGFGQQPSGTRVIQEFLFNSVAGRGVAQIVAAALVLLFALGVRALPPKDVPRIERRSPLEHVDALARAYERIGATRLVARRLAAGLRRRHGRGAWSARAAATGPGDADQRFLAAVVTGHPGVAADAERILSAERVPVAADALQAVADAVDHIDQAFPPLKT